MQIRSLGTNIRKFYAQLKCLGIIQKTEQGECLAHNRH